MNHRHLLPVFLLAILSLFSFRNSESFEGRYISVKLTSTHLISNDSVGHEWDHSLLIGEQVIKKNEKVTFKLKKRAPLTIVAQTVEKDPKYDDVGKSEITFTYSDLIAIDKSSFKIDIIVIENGGQHAGNLAQWMYYFELAKETAP